jgi:hypothetical protein
MKNRKRLKVISLIVLALLILTTITMGIFAFLNKNKSKIIEIKYGNIVQFARNKIIEFPDFTLEYNGTTKTSILHGEWKITNYNFEIKRGNEIKNVKWSAGMGEISAQEFSVNNKNYYLELKGSIKYYPKRLKNNELVILDEKSFNELNKP